MFGMSLFNITFTDKGVLKFPDRKVGLGTENWDDLNLAYLDHERDRFDTSGPSCKMILK